MPQCAQATSSSQIWSSLFISEESYLDSKNGGWSLPPFKQSLLFLPLLWKPLILRDFCLDNIQAVVLATFIGAKGCNGPYWHLPGPKAPTKLPSLLGLTQARTFSYLTSAHRESWLKGFCGGSKIELFYPYFCIHKIYLTPVSHAQSPKAVWKHFQICLKLLVPSLLFLLLSRDLLRDRLTPGKEYNIQTKKQTKTITAS